VNECKPLVAGSPPRSPTKRPTAPTPALVGEGANAAQAGIR